jgi:hypothetical protein
MRRILLLTVLLLLVAACRPSPQSRADEWAGYFPEEVSEWEADRDDDLTLNPEDFAGMGHVTITYEGDDDALAYVTIEAYATDTAADIALNDTLKDWQLMGIQFDRSSPPGPRYYTGATPGGTLILLQQNETVFTLAFINGEEPIPEAEVEVLLELLLQIVDTYGD